MNIKNERVHALAREAASRTGTSQTSALEAALTMYLESLGGVDGAREADVAHRVDVVRTLVAEVNLDLTAEDRRAVYDEMTTMYDEAGLPR